MARLEWHGVRLMLGTLVLGEVREAGMMSGNLASYTLAGGFPVTVGSSGRWKDTNASARLACAKDVEKALRDAGVEVEL